MAVYHTAMKLSRILSNQNGVSRRRANALIASGAVSVDGIVCRSPASEVSEFQRVTHGDHVAQHGGAAHYLMLNKPAGILSATSDKIHQTVLDLVDTEQFAGLHVAGRLDRASTGLIILTNDGRWSRALTEPSERKPKVYTVSTASRISADTAVRFAEGIWFEYEQLLTSPASLELLDEHQARVTIYEGRYHQIKRMFHAVGNRVTALHRERMGNITLDPSLPPGSYRPLTEGEIANQTAR